MARSLPPTARPAATAQRSAMRAGPSRGGNLPNLNQRHNVTAAPNAAPRANVKQMFSNRRRSTLPTAPRAGASIALGNYFETGGNAMRGGGKTFKCKEEGCQNMIVPGIDDMYGSGNDGPYCREHWADIWVEHPMYNRPNMPICKVGIRWTEPEWNAIQTLVSETVKDFLSNVDTEGRPRVNWQPRYPRAEELNQLFEKNFKRSVDCPWCKAHVPFVITCDDLTIPGVNAPIQQQ